MMLGLVITAIVIAVLLIVVTFVQVLYLESQRLRSRETAALQFFKEHLEEKLGWKAEHGALACSSELHRAARGCGRRLARPPFSRSSRCS